jgi:acetyl-CoA synthetase
MYPKECVMLGQNSSATKEFLAARDLLVDLRDDHEAAVAQFQWPRPTEFNWAIDWFDEIARDNRQPALLIVNGDRLATISYAELSERSCRAANWLRARGVRRGDRVLLMLDNRAATWEAILAAMKVGAVVIPTYTTASTVDLADRIERGRVAHVITSAQHTDSFAGLPASVSRICVGEPVAGWLRYDDAYAEPALYRPDAVTNADDELFLYFTSGTTSRPKLARHTHSSYPIGHLSGMYWNGLRPGDVHLNVSAPGWAKHAWSSFFGPFNAGATILAVNAGGSAEPLLDAMVRHGATTFCAPPTVWRMLIQHDLGRWPVTLRETCSVGEPLNPEVIEQVRRSWGLTVRDGYGQTETTAQIGNTTALAVKPGSMGKPLPGYSIVLVDPATGRPASEGEICVDMSTRPIGVMTGYLNDPDKTARTFEGGYYHTGDIGYRDVDGYITYVGRTDDVFKSYDHRISPFELESLLLEHEAVVEAAVIPSPDPVGLVVPKAYIALRAGRQPSSETARSILTHARENLAPHQWIRLVEFADLPKTVSGKIRRAELRAQEQRRETGDGAARREYEYRAEELFGAAQPVPLAPGL